MKVIKKLAPVIVGIGLLTFPYTCGNSLERAYRQTKTETIECYEKIRDFYPFSQKRTEEDNAWEKEIDKKIEEIRQAVFEKALSDKRVLRDYNLEANDINMYFALKKYKSKIEKYAEILNSEELIPYYMAVLYGESSGRPFVKSKHDAYGLFQVKYNGAFLWAWELLNNPKKRKKYPEISTILSDFEGGDKEKLWEKVKRDPDMNIRLGMAYLYFCWQINEHDVIEALKDYGTGRRGKKKNPEAAKKYVKYIKETKNEISEVFEKIEKIKTEKRQT